MANDKDTMDSSPSQQENRPAANSTATQTVTPPPPDPTPSMETARTNSPIPLPYGPHLPVLGGDLGATTGSEESWDLPSTSGQQNLSSENETADAIDDNGHRYVGLVNQAMTCYLNSLLQTLYMTPEFRNALFKWEFTGAKVEEVKNIPYQLQKLFLLLQTSDKYSLETKDLTKSFGWDSSAAWDQHDVQELFRVMFEALETKWRKTRQATLIQELYKGCMRDYVKCLKCGTENAREDVFLDLPLAVKPFGANAAFKSIEEALSAFVQPERLDGSNQYECEHCKSKTDAHKGLKITRFPYMLTIQLKRFDFNYVTLHRVKLNDRMTFPDLLNLNPFVDKVDDEAQSGTTDPEPMDVSPSDGQQQSSTPGSTSTAKPADDVDEGISLNDSNRSSPEGETDVFDKENLIVGKIDRQAVEGFLAQGPFVYELFSIMVHSGSANGGHYYAYVKNIDQDSWYCFNDSSVRRANLDDLHRSYGGHSGGWAFSNTNAYMLMYRQMDANRNDRFIQTAELPSHLVHLLERLKKEEHEERQMREYQDSLVKVDVSCQVDGEAVEKDTIEIVKTETLSKLLQKVHKVFKLEQKNVSIDCCRLWILESQWSLTLGNCLEDSMDGIIYNVLPWSKTLFVETKSVNEKFNVVKDKSLTVLTFIVDLEKECVQPERYIAMPKNVTVSEAQNILSEKFGTDPSKIRIVAERNGNFVFYDQPERTLCPSEFVWANRIEAYVDPGYDLPAYEQDRVIDFKLSLLRRVIDRHKNMVEVKIRMPSTMDFQRASLPLPPCLLDDSDVLPAVDMPVNSGFVYASAMIDVENNSTNTQFLGGFSHQNMDDSVSASQSSSCMITPDPSPQVSPNVSPDSNFIPVDDDQLYRICDKYLPDVKFEVEGEIITVTTNSPNGSDMGDDSSSKCTIKGEDDDIPVGDEPISSPPSAPQLEVPDDRSGAVTPTISVNYFKLDRIESETDGSKIFYFEVDGRMILADLRSQLSNMMEIGENEFTIKKVLQSKLEYDISDFTQTVKSAANIESVLMLVVALGRPLQYGEQLVHMKKFELTENEDKFTLLFDLIVRDDSTGSEILDETARNLDKICGIKWDLNKLRLRLCDGDSFPVFLMNEKAWNDSIRFRSKDTLYLQFLEGDEPLMSEEGKRSKAVFGRRWFPSSLTYGQVLDVVIPIEATIEHIKQQIEHLSGIPADRIQFAEENRFIDHKKFPYERERIDMLDKIQFYSEKDKFELHPGQLIHFRDSAETPKVLSAEERRQIQIKDSNTFRSNTATYYRRKERPLKIWASSSICEDDLD